MPEMPRDPRQLARDILSGKVKIEDLARERQMRGGGGGAIRPAPPPPPQARVGPVVRPAPARPIPPPVQRSLVSPTRRAQVMMKAPPKVVVAAPAREARSALEVPDKEVHAYDRPKELQDLSKPAVARRRITPKDLVRSRTALRQSIIMAEVLGKPLGLRD